MAIKKKPAAKVAKKPVRRTARQSAIPAPAPVATAAPSPVTERAGEAAGQPESNAGQPEPTMAAEVTTPAESPLADLIADAKAEEAPPSEEGAAAPAGGMTRDEVLELASGGVLSMLEVGEGVLQNIYPYVNVPKDVKTRVAQRGAPLMLKYSGGEPPAWLNEWKDEILFGLATGSMIYSVITQIRAHEAEQQRLLEEQEQRRQEAQSRLSEDSAISPVAPPSAAPNRVDLTTDGHMTGIKPAGDL